jgi:hypothetical protein
MKLENMFILLDGHSIPISYEKATETRYLRQYLRQNLRLKIQNPYKIRVLAYGVSFESVAQNSRPMGFSIKNGEGIVRDTGFLKSVLVRVPCPYPLCVHLTGFDMSDGIMDSRYVLVEGISSLPTPFFFFCGTFLQDGLLG